MSLTGRSRRSSRDKNDANPDPKISNHPAASSAIDAAAYDIDFIINELKNKTPLSVAFDFIDMPDADIERLFVTERMRKRAWKAPLIFPPKALRRTARQIRDFFAGGAKQQRELIEKYSNYKIVKAPHPPTPHPPTPQLPTPHPLTPRPSKCAGFKLDYIQEMCVHSEERREKLMIGFMHVVREGLVRRSQISQPLDDKWEFSPPTVGVVSGTDNKTDRWRIHEHPHDDSDDQFQFMTIHDVECVGGEVTKFNLCDKCHQSRLNLLRRFTSAVELRSEFHPKTKDAILERSTSLQKYKLDYHRNESKKKSKKIAYRDKVVAQLCENTGIDVPINSESDSVFNDPDVQASVNDFLEQKKVTQNGIAAYAFKESMRKHKLAKERGARAVRHCPLMIRLGCVIRRKMGYAGGLYDLVAKICGLPMDRNIRRYAIPNSNDPDGVIHSNIQMARDAFNQKHPNANLFAFERHVTVAMDAMHCKGRFGVSYHNNELVAVADDAFNEKVIENELLQLQQNDGKEDKENETVLPAITKHFLIFIATTWAQNSKQQFLVARYGLESVTSSFLVPTIRQLAVVLSIYGWNGRWRK